MAETNESSSPNSISLSEALLAPLNSIFEAQIHASRAFLSFFLQMGFRHKYTEEDKELLRKDPEGNKKILDEIEAEEADRKTIENLTTQKQQLESKTTLTDADRAEIDGIDRQVKQLKVRWGSLYQQPIEYLDGNGEERVIFIPNLSLLPVKPLAINNANFKFEMRVKDASQSVDATIRSATRAAPKRPWFLIDTPRKIEGEFAPQRSESTKDKSEERTISIDVTVGATEIPYGLHKLISALTGMARDEADANK